MSGLFAAKKRRANEKKFKKTKVRRYSVKAEGAPLFRAIVLSKSFVEARQPSSGLRKVVKVQI